MSTILAARRLWLTSLLALIVVAASFFVAAHHGRGSTPTKVLGEKVTGSGSSVDTAGNNGCGNGNGGSNGSKDCAVGNKSFTISGTAVGLYPGGTVQLQLAVTNPENQAMTVNSLSASLGTIVKAAGAPSGTCTPTVTIGAWTGSSFELPKNAVALAAPGYIPVTVAHSAPDACQGATFNLVYSGSAVQK